MKYDVFVSYRRSDAFTANLVAEKLKNLGYSVFFDVETLRSGNFNTQLYDVIKGCKDFVLVLPPNALDRCISEEDWIRKEVCHAMECNKNIIPVLLSGFNWPDPMPKGMEQLKFYQAITASDAEYFDMSIKKLSTYLRSKPSVRRKFVKMIYTIAISVLSLILLGLGLWQFTTYRVCVDIVDKFSHDISIVDILYTQNQRLDKVWEEYKMECRTGNSPLSKTAIDSIFLNTISSMRAEAESYNGYLLMDSVFSQKQINVCARYNITEADLKAIHQLTWLCINNYTHTCDLISNSIKTYGPTEINDLIVKMNIETFPPYCNTFFFNYLATLASFPKHTITKYRQHAREWKNFSTKGGVHLSPDEYISASEEESGKANNIVEKYVAEIEKIKREIAVDIARHSDNK